MGGLLVYAAASLREVTQIPVALALGNVVPQRGTRSVYGMALQASNVLVGCGTGFVCDDLPNQISREMDILPRRLRYVLMPARDFVAL